MLELNGVTLRRGAQTVLDHAHLQLDFGERVGLIGSSGAGKSSLLAVIAGTLPVDGGQVHSCFVRLGMVFQQPRLLPWRSVFDNVRIPLRAAGFGREAARAAANDWLHWVGLGARLRAWPGQLSGGEAHRVALARAFACKPDLLLLDEPFSALDPALRQQMRAICREGIRGTHAAMIYVSHHPLELHELVDGCLQLEHGHLQRCPLPGAARLAATTPPAATDRRLMPRR